MVWRVARCCKNLDAQVAQGDLVAVADGGAFEGDSLGTCEEVRDAEEAGQLEAAADVVVVDVGLRDVRDAHPALSAASRPGRCRVVGPPPGRPHRRGAR